MSKAVSIISPSMTLLPPCLAQGQLQEIDLVQKPCYAYSRIARADRTFPVHNEAFVITKPRYSKHILPLPYIEVPLYLTVLFAWRRPSWRPFHRPAHWMNITFSLLYKFCISLISLSVSCSKYSQSVFFVSLSATAIYLYIFLFVEVVSDCLNFCFLFVS